MPQINRVRIVNFSFNDGKRLISDELFDFCNANSNKALNTLINLANGGGKSVLVQLMMQPILPKAQVAGRKIESFFTKSTDHCFILLEWNKDNSSEKLLTGIALAAGETSSADEDNTRGVQVKYYTFLSNYSNYRTQYNIISMPLARKEDHHFTAESFDFIRLLAKRSTGALEYFSSDDTAPWRNRLTEYGIYQSEWKNTIGRINAEEGGMSKFFGEFKRAATIIDKLFLPTIEAKLNAAENQAEDHSLRRMFRNYAKQFSEQKEKILLRDTATRFVEEMKREQTTVETLWTLNDQYEQSIHCLFGFLAALSTEMKTLEIKIEEISSQLAAVETEVLQIKLERASADFYKTKAIFDDLSAALAELHSKENQLKNELASTEQSLLIQECAMYAERMRKLENELSALRSEIEQKESDSEAGQQLAGLRYSSSCAIAAELPHCRQEQSELAEEAAALRRQHEQLLKAVQTAKAAAETSDKAASRLNGKLESAEEELERLAADLQVKVDRRLDGSYDPEALNASTTAKLIEQEKLQTEEQENSELQKQIEERLEKIPLKIGECEEKQRQVIAAKEQIARLIGQYKAAEQSILRISEQYNLSFANRFTTLFSDYLQAEINLSHATEAKLQRAVMIAEEELAAVKSGTVHVPKAVIDYMSGTGVNYQTCEQYLLSAVSNGNLTKEHCLEILQNYPEAAYGLLLDAKALDTLLQAEPADWLPAMVPLFSYEQMEKLLAIQSEKRVALAFYSEEYFSDKEHYLEKLEAKKQKCIADMDQGRERLSALQLALDVVAAFNYEATWLATQEEQLRLTENELSMQKKHRERLENEQVQLKERQAASREFEKKITEDLRRYRNWFEALQALKVKIELTESSYRQYYQALAEAEADKISAKKLENECEQGRSRREQAENLLKSLEARLAELTSVWSEVKDAPQAELLQGSWRDLMAQYHILIKNQNDSLAVLQVKLEGKLQEKKNAQAEVDKRHCEAALYQGVAYSQQLEQELSAAKIQLKRLKDEIEIKIREDVKQCATAEARFKQSLSAVRELAEEPLAKEQIGSRFLERLQEKMAGKQGLEAERKATERQLNTTRNCLEMLQTESKDYPQTNKITEIVLEANLMVQKRGISEKVKQSKKAFQEAEQQFMETLRRLEASYAVGNERFQYAIHSIFELVRSDNGQGDRYYTILEQVKSSLDTTKKKIAQITADLKDIDSSHADLVHQCVIQGKQIYEQLRQLSESSKVQLFDNRTRQLMLRFDLPDAVDENVAFASVQNEINRGVSDIIALLSGEPSEFELDKAANRVVGSRNLLNRYIGRENIAMQVYKIDSNPQNCKYRSWEETQINNSGGEKFVIYFAVILALMSYSRNTSTVMSDKSLSSVLILDNPFGPITSAHLLKPMFEIARHFHVQLICLSDISKCDITACFDILIKAVIKSRPLSSIETLSQDGEEKIEHGFFRAEQTSMFQGDGGVGTD